jgi:hypothetical protein
MSKKEGMRKETPEKHTNKPLAAQREAALELEDPGKPHVDARMKELRRVDGNYQLGCKKEEIHPQTN